MTPAGQPQRRPRTEEEKAEILRLHALGHGRNEIMRITGFGAKAITTTVHNAGLSFARADMTAEATEARRRDLEVRRINLALALTADAERLREQVWEPSTVFAFGGRENTFASEELEEPPPADKRALLAAAGMAIDRSLRLVPPKAGTGADEALSMLGSLAAGIARVVEEDTSGEG